MSCCSCHINPPCDYCVESYECIGCGDIKHPDEDGENFSGEDVFCDGCSNNLANEAQEQDNDFIDRLNRENNE